MAEQAFHPALGPLEEAGSRMSGSSASSSESARIELHSFDATTAPLDFARRHADALGYPAPHAEALRQLSEEGFAQAGPVAWRLHHGDFRECLHGAPTPAAIFFDPYSPRANPEMSFSRMLPPRLRLPFSGGPVSADQLHPLDGRARHAAAGGIASRPRRADRGEE